MDSKNYTWKEVCSWLGIEYREHGDYAIHCPCCDPKRDRSKKLYVNADNRSFYCFRCGAKGGVIDLYANFRGISFEEAKKEMRSRRSSKTTSYCFTKAEELPTTNDEPIIKLESRGIKQTSAVYEAMVEYLKLNFGDRALLRKRGLTDAQIDEFRFRSLPQGSQERKKMVNNLLEQGFDLLGIPGFYEADAGIKFVPYENGILIPLLGVTGKIQGFQIRSSRNNAKNKYFALSSGSKEKGCKSQTYVHCIGMKPDTKACYLTEGALKADVAHALSGIPFLSVLGVKCLKHLPKYLKSYPLLKTVYICYDMDKFTNSNVMQAQKELVELLKDNGINPIILNWNREYKGIDDYLLMKKEVKK